MEALNFNFPGDLETVNVISSGDIEAMVSQEINSLFTVLIQSEITGLQQQITAQADILFTATQEKYRLEQLLLSKQKELESYTMIRPEPEIITIPDSPMQSPMLCSEPVQPMETTIPSSSMSIDSTQKCLMYVFCHGNAEVDGYCKMHSGKFTTCQFKVTSDQYCSEFISKELRVQFCSIHICAQDQCYFNIAPNSKYCHIHRICIKKGCHETVHVEYDYNNLATGLIYCVKHKKCEYSACSNTAVENSKYCDIPGHDYDGFAQRMPPSPQYYADVEGDLFPSLNSTLPTPSLTTSTPNEIPTTPADQAIPTVSKPPKAGRKRRYVFKCYDRQCDQPEIEGTYFCEDHYPLNQLGHPEHFNKYYGIKKPIKRQKIVLPLPKRKWKKPKSKHPIKLKL